MKIAIITMHAARNYGAVLQTYALQHYCEKIGYDAEVIDYKLPNQTTKGYLLNINSKFKKNVFLKTAYLAKTVLPKCITTKLFSDFIKRKIRTTEPVKIEDGGIKYPKADVYCAGSDQIWNPRANGGFNSAYFLKGARGKKFSYASSIGIDSLTPSEQSEIKEYLKDFNYISVRELSSIPMLNQIGYSPVCVLDPTLMLNKDEWNDFSNDFEKEEVNGEAYLLVYYFGNAKAVMNYASQIAKKRGLKIRRISVGFEKYSNDVIVERYITPERFVSLFSNASYVVTNSFHGTVFSINFEKQFLSYPTTENNARFASVFQMFGLEDRNLRLYSADEAVMLSDIDYTSVSAMLENKRKDSFEYIKCALHNEV